MPTQKDIQRLNHPSDGRGNVAGVTVSSDSGAAAGTLSHEFDARAKARTLDRELLDCERALDQVKILAQSLAEWLAEIVGDYRELRSRRKRLENRIRDIRSEMEATR